MATYNLALGGVQGLTPGTRKLFVHVATFPLNAQTGQAIPTNYYHVGLLRISYQGAVYPVLPIDARDMIVELPADADALGYNLFAGTLIQVTEA